MTEPIRFTVYGVAQPQGSKTAFINKRTGRAVLAEGRRGKARETFKDWRGAVADAARGWQGENMLELLDEPVRLEVVFRLPKPASGPKWRLWARSRPDLDKLCRSVLDALTGVIFVDDSRVVELLASKPYAVDGPPHASITVVPLGHVEELERQRLRALPRAKRSA